MREGGEEAGARPEASSLPDPKVEEGAEAAATWIHVLVTRACPPCAVVAPMRASPPWPPCASRRRGCAWDEGERWSGA